MFLYSAAVISFSVLPTPALVLAEDTSVVGGDDETPIVQPKPGGDKVVGLINPLGNQSLIGFFESILDVIMIFAVPIIVFFIIYAGFLYVTAQGNESKVSTAHMALLYAVIGGVIILGARVILAVISGTIQSF